MAETKGLWRSAGSISLATLMSRILGLARDQVQSYYFGASWVTDAFVAAFRVGNLLRDLFAEGALSSAFVPTFTAERERHGAAAAWALASRVITALVVVLGGLAIVLGVFAPEILRLYVFGFDLAKMDLAVRMTRILSPFLLCAALAAVAMGILNICGRFFLPALAPAWFNVTSILGVVLLVPLLQAAGFTPGLALAIGAMAGGAVQFLVQVPSLGREGFRFRWDWAPADPGLRRVAILMLPATFGLAATQINILVDTVLASRFGDGPITWLQLAFRLLQLPIGIFGVALATANLTRVSRDASRGDDHALRLNLAAALRAVALFTLPATAGLIALREPIVRVLFEHGRFTPESTLKTAAAVACYALGLYAYAATKIQVPTFYALGETRRPVVASAVAVAVKIVANFAFIAAAPALGLDPFLALALSTSLAAWTNFHLLTRALAKRLGTISGLGVASAAARIGGLSAVMGVLCGGLNALLARFAAGGGFLGELARLAVCIAAGMACVGVGAVALRIPEALSLLERARRFAGMKPLR